MLQRLTRVVRRLPNRVVVAGCALIYPTVWGLLWWWRTPNCTLDAYFNHPHACPAPAQAQAFLYWLAAGGVAALPAVAVAQLRRRR